MKKIAKINQYNVYQLDKKTAYNYVDEITNLANLIPLVDYSQKDILAESKPDRVFYHKWDHSLIVFDGDNPIAIIIAYEREKENNNQYPNNNLYISELAVDNNYQKQGIARKLIEIFLDINKSLLHFNDNLIFNIQTNSADWNQHVINLYKSFGFKEVTTKEYPNRTDIILILNQT